MRTALINTEAPASFVQLADVKKQLRIADADSSKDDLLQMYIDAVCAHLDGADGSLKRAVASQSWKLVLPSFRLGQCPPWRIELPLPPCRSVTKIEYYAPGVDAIQALAEGAYRLVNRGTERSRLVPTGTWPSTQCREDAVAITYAAGYGAEEGQIAMPKTISQAAIVMIKGLYDMGERNVFLTSDTVIGVASKQFQVSDAANSLMERCVDNLLFNVRLTGA